MADWTGRRNAGGEGINITGSGNQVNTGRVGGDQRQVHVSGGGGSEAATVLLKAQQKSAELETALAVHAGDLNNPDLARRIYTRIDEELHSAAPDRRRIAENLQDLSLAVGSAASLTAVVQAFATAVNAVTS
ncbi:hypothetical protein [Streptomyces sp. NPDC059753]|uniref:hypothetical protein n=1 Tax=Streptomyces sp. NPDC059753 TaxID=3346933 RepID=UPI0036650C3A